MSFTCQPPPARSTVMAYELLVTAEVVFPVRPVLDVCWVSVTTKVKLDGPNARSAVISPLPDADCFCWVLTWARPGVANPLASIADRVGVTRPLIRPA